MDEAVVVVFTGPVQLPVRHTQYAPSVPSDPLTVSVTPVPGHTAAEGAPVMPDGALVRAFTVTVTPGAHAVGPRHPPLA
jgi:hypothetical protein